MTKLSKEPGKGRSLGPRSTGMTCDQTEQGTGQRKDQDLLGCPFQYYSTCTFQYSAANTEMKRQDRGCTIPGTRGVGVVGRGGGGIKQIGSAAHILQQAVGSGYRPRA